MDERLQVCTCSDEEHRASGSVMSSESGVVPEGAV